MNTKDGSLFKKIPLMQVTRAGKDIIKQALLREKGYRQFKKYDRETEEQFQEFTKRFLLSLHRQIISDSNPAITLKKFTDANWIFRVRFGRKKSGGHDGKAIKTRNPCG